MLERVADVEAGRNSMRDGVDGSFSTQKADGIVSRAEGRGMVSHTAEGFDNGDARLNRLDMTAAVIGAIMTIGPLFAAFVGRLMPPN